jgi:hypothetical protein
MFAVVRLLAGVCAGVNSQCTSLNEALAAIRVVALVRALVCVYPIMPLQIRLAVEALWVASATSSSPPAPKASPHVRTFPQPSQSHWKARAVVGSLSTISMTSISGDFWDPGSVDDIPRARGSVRARAGTDRLRTFATYMGVSVSPPRNVGGWGAGEQGGPGDKSGLSMRGKALGSTTGARLGARGGWSARSRWFEAGGYPGSE